MRRKPPGSMDHQRSVAARFSAAAATYDSHAAGHVEVAEKVAGMICDLPPARRVLEIGCGTGILTEKLAQVCSNAFINAIDVSPDMIQRAQARLAGCGRILWIVGNLDTVRQGAPFELVASSSSLHWITPLEFAFKGIWPVLVPGGHLAFSLMLEGTFAELHHLREKIAPWKQTRGRLPAESEVLEALRNTGFDILSRERTTCRREFASANDFLRSIHDQGMTGGIFSSAGASLTRGELRKLVSEYDSTYKSKEGGVLATIEVLYVVARKPV